jgi:ubiquinone/menaquinone biosynthesis C-methylase UbiE
MCSVPTARRNAVLQNPKGFPKPLGFPIPSKVMTANQTYQQFAYYYDAYVQGFDKDLAFYQALCRKADAILEVGCGTGRVLQRFLADGFACTGVDISDEMLAVARQKLAPFCQTGQLRLIRHDFLQAPLPERYHTVLVTFYTFNYILQDPETFLRHISLSMSDGATLVMDLFYPKTLEHRELDHVWTTKEFCDHEKLIILRDKRAFSGDLEERIQIYQEAGQETCITTIRKYYPPTAIKRVLETVGFTVITFSEKYDVHNFQDTLPEKSLQEHFVVKAVKNSAD